MEEGRRDGEITARRSDTRRMRGIFSLRGHAHPSFYAAFFTIVRLFNPPLCHVSAPFDSHCMIERILENFFYLERNDEFCLVKKRMENGSGYFKHLGNFLYLWKLFVLNYFVKKKNRKQKILMNNNGIKCNVFINPNQIHVQYLFHKNWILLIIYMH